MASRQRALAGVRVPQEDRAGLSRRGPGEGAAGSSRRLLSYIQMRASPRLCWQDGGFRNQRQRVLRLEVLGWCHAGAGVALYDN